MSTLLSNHTIKSLFKDKHANDAISHCLSLKNMMSIQQLKIKSSIVDVNNCLNGIFSLFNSLNKELFPSSKIINIFSSHFSFHQANCKYKESKLAHL